MQSAALAMIDSVRLSDRSVQFSSVQFSRDRSCGLREFAEVFPVPTFRDVRLRTAGAFEAAKIASLCHERRTSIVELLGV